MSPRIARSLVLVIVLASTACAGFKPLPVSEAPFHDRVQTQTQDGVTVAVAVPTVAEARELFDTKLDKKRIQPVWIEITNDTADPVWVFPYSIDRDYFPPLEVAWKSHRTWAKKTNRAIDAFYYDEGISWEALPERVTSGFVFVNLDLGYKYVPMVIVGDDRTREFEFFVKDPAFRADFSKIDFSVLNDGVDIVDYEDESEFLQWVEDLPCCTRNQKQTKTGDPLNFVIVSSVEEFRNGFVRAGWHLTAEMTTGTAFKTGAAAVFGNTYKHAPISPLYVYERPQDIGLQKARWNIHQRNHLRLWLAPVTYRREMVWIGQISRDIGSRLTTKSSTLTTHKIDPDVDEARDFLALDLIDSNALAAFGYVDGVGGSTPDDPGRNLTGDPFFTDGQRAVLFLSSEKIELEDVDFLEW